MQQTFTAVVKREAGGWIGWIEEVPDVNCQEASREELLESLRTTLAEALEFNRQEAQERQATTTKGFLSRYEAPGYPGASSNGDKTS